MGAVKHITISLAFLALAMLSMRAVGSESVMRAPESRHMRCLLKITADAAVVPPDSDVLASLLWTDAVAGKAARTALNADFDEIGESVDVRLVGMNQESQTAEGPSIIEVAIPSGPQVILLSLVVDLPDGVKPAAREFGTALMENLRHELQRAFNAHVEMLRDELKQAKTEQDATRVALAEAMKGAIPADAPDIRLDPADEAVQKQLDVLVDLSALKPEMPFEEAIDLIRRSVKPSLQIVVLWRELLDNAQVEQSTPINVDGLPNVRLSVGLKKLLEAMSNPPLEINLDYVVDSGVITVGTDLSLPPRTMETRVHEVPALLRAAGRTDGLKQLIEETIEPDSWFELSEQGKGSIVACGDAKLVARQTPEVHQRIAELLWAMTPKASIAAPVDAPREVLEQQIESLLAYRDKLDGEIDTLQDRQRVLGQKKDDPEKQGMESSLRTTSSTLYRAVADLEAVRAHILVGDQGSPDAQALSGIIDRIKGCADGCSRSVPTPKGGYDNGLVDLAWPPVEGTASNEAQTLSSRLVVKQSELEQVSRRIAGLQDALIGRTALDPEVHGLQLAARRLKDADLRAEQLERQIVELQPCAVTILGDSN